MGLWQYQWTFLAAGQQKKNYRAEKPRPPKNMHLENPARRIQTKAPKYTVGGAGLTMFARGFAFSDGSFVVTPVQHSPIGGGEIKRLVQALQFVQRA